MFIRWGIKNVSINNSLWILASTDGALYGITTLLANSMGIFFINGKPSFINGSRILPRHSPDYMILDIFFLKTLCYLMKLYDNSLKIIYVEN